MQIVEYRKHYEIFLNGEDSPISVSETAGNMIMQDLMKTPNGFIMIHGTLYNRFNIKKIAPFEEKLTEAHLSALAFHKELEDKKKELGIN